MNTDEHGCCLMGVFHGERRAGRPVLLLLWIAEWRTSILAGIWFGRHQGRQDACLPRPDGSLSSFVLWDARAAWGGGMKREEGGSGDPR